jgi:polyferredoxin
MVPRHLHLLRRLSQTSALVLTNLFARGWLDGSIYTGSSKAFCIPGLHCYSCPSSVLACPIGSLQSLIGSGRAVAAGVSSLRTELLILPGLVGFVLLPGFLAGRVACGWVCPFGFLQDLLFRLTGRRERIRPPAGLSGGKFLFLAVFVLLLPLLLPTASGAGEPWFCKVVCPSGTALAGWPLVAHHGSAVFSLGFLFGWKSAIAFSVLVWATVTRRPFCRFICPLGAIWGLAGKVSIFRMQVSESQCVSCGKCEQDCPMGVRIDRDPSSADCIRCGRCTRVCPTDAISHARASR